MSKYSIDHLYEKGRIFPDGHRNSENHPTPDAAHRHDYHHHAEHEVRRPQMPEEQPDHSGGAYENDVSKKSWLQSGKATDKPFFRSQ